jgi:uncharacterized protein (UPF0210 family)
MTAPIRTITLGMAERHPLTGEAVAGAANLLRRFEAAYQEAGYEVQTLRLSTRPMFIDLADRSPGEMVRYARDLQGHLDAVGLEFCSLGMVPAWSPDVSLEHVELIPDLLVGCASLNATVQLAQPGSWPRSEAARAAARVISRLAEETEEGFGNFRFAALACVPAGTPFFPAAYHEGPASVSIGIQGAGIVRGALHGQSVTSDLLPVMDRVRDAIRAYADPVVGLAEQAAHETGIVFGGVDLSPAPNGADSIVAAIEAAAGVPFGSAGTLSAVSAITAGIKSVDVPTCGYNGLMLPVLEDALLGQRWTEGLVDTRALLFYSAVCGTGLDTIPLAGDTDSETIARILMDVATLAVRLNKPLSARLFPVPGTHSGDMTRFTSPYLTNTVVRSEIS